MPLKLTDDVLNNPNLSSDEKLLIAAIRQGAKFGAPLVVDLSNKPNAIAHVKSLHEHGLVQQVQFKGAEGEQWGTVGFTLEITAVFLPADQKKIEFKEPKKPDGAAPDEPKKEGTEARFGSLEVPEPAVDPNTLALGPERLKEIAALNSCETLGNKTPKVKGIVDIDGTEYVCIGSSRKGDEITSAWIKIVRRKGADILPSETVAKEFKHKKIEYVIVEEDPTLTVVASLEIPIAEAAAADSLEEALVESLAEIVDPVAHAIEHRATDEFTTDVTLQIGENIYLAMVEIKPPFELVIVLNPGDGGKQIFTSPVESEADGLALAEAKLRELIALFAGEPTTEAPDTAAETSAEGVGGGAVIYFDFDSEPVDNGPMGTMLDHTKNEVLYRLVRMPSGSTQIIRDPGENGTIDVQTHSIDFDAAKRIFAEFLLADQPSLVEGAPANESTEQVDEAATTPAAETPPIEAPSGGAALPERVSQSYSMKVDGVEVECQFIADYVPGRTDLFQITAEPFGKKTFYVQLSDYAANEWSTVNVAIYALAKEELDKKAVPA